MYFLYAFLRGSIKGLFYMHLCMYTRRPQRNGTDRQWLYTPLVPHSLAKPATTTCLTLKTSQSIHTNYLATICSK